jgi:long-chain acyl-CoA synthetase
MSNFYQRFLQSAERTPEGVAIEMQRQAGPPERYTYARLRAMADSIGQWLTTCGVQPGARCAILAANGPRWVACYLGTMAAGMVAVPLDTAFNPEQVGKLLENSGASLLFADVRHLPAAEAAAAARGVRLVAMDDAEGAAESLARIVALPASGFRAVDLAADQIAAILYTSGTTSDPKGVMLTHANIAAETEAVFSFVPIGPSDAILGVLPLFHALAQMANLLLPLAGSARVVFLESLNTAELLRVLKERDVTLFCCVPQFFYLIHERIRKEVGARGRLAESTFGWALKVSGFSRRFGFNLGKLLFRPVHHLLGPRMRYLVTGGSRLDPEIGRAFQAMGFELLQAYGLTETSGGALCTRAEENVMGSVGKPLAGVEMKLRDAKPPGDGSGPAVGEILLRGDIVMKGYYNRPDATAAVLHDGWLHTGDLGALDARGNLFITGREKEMIVLSSGKNIYPEEIEAHYLKSPFVKEICVLGLESRPGEPYAERLHAVVVPNVEVLRERKIVNMREVIRFDIETLSAQLPSTKRILSFEIWQDDLPRTTTRKIKRFEIERRVRERQASGTAASEEGARALTDADRAWIEEPDVAQAIAVVRSALKDPARAVHPRDNLELDLGLDSMERVELLVAVEQALGASVPDSIVSEVYTVRELVDAVRASRGSGAAERDRAAWAKILETEPTDPEVLSVARRHPLAERWWYLFGRFVHVLARDLYHLKVSGLEKLPKSGPFIISPNHQSFLDPPVLVSALPWRVLRDAFYVGTSEIFGSGPLRRLARTLKLIPVDPDANLVPAMRAGAYGLRHGKVLILYPEGERSIDGTPKTFKKGAAILATHLKVPIVPVAMEGFYEAWPRGQGFKFTGSRFKIAFGDPIYPPEHAPSHESTYEQLTGELKRRVVEMWDSLRDDTHDAPQASAR